jgi:hypothetical protein
MRTLLLIGVLFSIAGCVVTPVRGGPPAPPRPMNYNEAVNMGFQFCRSRGYECQLKDAHMKGYEVWKVKFTAFAPGARGHVHLDYDAYSRALLKVKENVRARKGDWKDDDDDDDDDDRGRGRGKGHGKHND